MSINLSTKDEVLLNYAFYGLKFFLLSIITDIDATSKQNQENSPRGELGNCFSILVNCL